MVLDSIDLLGVVLLVAVCGCIGLVMPRSKSACV